MYPQIKVIPDHSCFHKDLLMNWSCAASSCTGIDKAELWNSLRSISRDRVFEYWQDWFLPQRKKSASFRKPQRVVALVQGFIWNCRVDDVSQHVTKSRNLWSSQWRWSCMIRLRSRPDDLRIDGYGEQSQIVLTIGDNCKPDCRASGTTDTDGNRHHSHGMTMSCSDARLPKGFYEWS